ncbi:MAG: hypothetical protein M3Z31_11740 [Pseudomonadota bacterium]|nr:hypothetical protein [Pseudomonadota bacterium]
MDEAVEEALWNGVRSLEEKMLLLQHMARHSGHEELGSTEALKAQAAEAQHRSQLVRKALGLDD